jgi:hypothetical protein
LRPGTQNAALGGVYPETNHDEEHHPLVEEVKKLQTEQPVK